MPRFRVPTAELRAIVDPVASDKWGAGPITLEECAAAIQADGPEFRSWQEVKDSIGTFKENRSYHLRRLGTLIGQAVNNPNPAPRAGSEQPNPADAAILR